MSWVCRSFLAALVLSHAAALADSSLDFSSERPGVVLDRLHPEAPPAHVRTEIVYGRRLGDAIDGGKLSWSVREKWFTDPDINQVIVSFG